MAWLILVSVALAGCAGGGGGKAKGTEVPVGDFQEFDLWLYPLSTKDSNGGWELYPGAKVDAWGFAPEQDKSKATIPGPEIRVKEGDTVRINFYVSPGTMAHTIHWHGLHVPWDMDGVPYVSQLPVGDRAFGGHGNLVSYEFTVNQTGTYWYHCHVDTAHHLDMGMYGAFIVEPRDATQDPPFDQEVTFMLDEWDRSHAHQNEQAIAAAISRSGDPRVTANDLYAFMRDYLLMNGVYNDTIARNLAGVPGIRETRDWYPITYAPYFAEYDTFLINGHAAPLTEPVMVESGETLRMRLINAGSQVHSMHLHGHHFQVTHKDGYLLPAPYYADTILLGPGERYDLYVRLDNPGPWMFHDHMPLNEANDYIHPGGMMTMICYVDGWEVKDLCHHGKKMQQAGQSFTVGDLLKGQYKWLVTQEVARELRTGSSEPSATSGPVDAVELPEIPAHSH